MTQRTYIIAELGVNHNGSLNLAKNLIDAAAKAGADAVKFQTFRADHIVTRSAAKAAYQKMETEAEESQYDMLKKLELDEAAHHALVSRSQKRGIQFLSTPFDLESLHLLTHKLGLPRIKLSSGDLTNAPLLLATARSKKAVILSTGMSTLAEVESALATLAFGYTNKGESPSPEAFHWSYCSAKGQNILKENVVLLHCTTEYPAPFEEVNLQAMDTMRSAFGLPVGLSDHTEGITIAIAAVARGAAVVEKHITLDHSLPGPDHKASLEPNQFKEMVIAIRQVELAIGSAQKIPSPSEIKNLTTVRKSLVAAVEIKKGQMFTETNLTVKRPGTGLPPSSYWALLGQKARKYYRKDELIEL